MNALAAIEARPIVRPEYRNERIRNFRFWYIDNLKTLETYFNALAPYVEGEPLEDFFSFAVTQHEMTDMALNKSPDRDPTPWCSGCGARTKDRCKCGPIASNE